MWWALSAIFVIVMIFVGKKIWKAHQQIKLIEAGRVHIWHSFQQLKPRAQRPFEKEIDHRVWNDSYLLGYIQGSLALMKELHCKGLSPLQSGMVSINILRDLARENWEEVSARIEVLYASNDPKFLEGMDDGSAVVILVAGKAGPRLLADPDVQEAIQNAPAHVELTRRVLGAVDISKDGAAGSLLLEKYMNRHAVRAGYREQ